MISYSLNCYFLYHNSILKLEWDYLYITVWTIPLSLVNITQILCVLYNVANLVCVLYNLLVVPILPGHCTKYIEKIQRCQFSMYFLQCCNKDKEKCNIAHIVCIWCNVLRKGRMGTMKRLYEIHSKFTTMYKIHRSFVTLTLER